MEELTPELERRIQVEELWGRRIVLEEVMNAWRLREYQSRRLLALLRDEDCAQRTPVKSTMPTRVDKAKPPHLWPTFGVRRAAVIVGLTAFGLFVAQQCYDRLLAEASFPSAHQTGHASHGTSAQIEAQTSKLNDGFWKRPAAKLRPLDADLKRIFGSSL